MRLKQYFVEKPWGRCGVPAPFDSLDASTEFADKSIGEIWLEPEDRHYLPILVKYMFTNEKLSVQVHPDDEQASARGMASGKNECWYITDAKPGAMLGLGLKSAMSAERLRDAALDGSIEDVLDWRTIHAGEFYIVPAGTIHAMSAGISLIEFQQNIDLTYRLYDYGRPRELHLEDAVAVAHAGPYSEELIKTVDHKGAKTQPLVCFPQFDVAYSRDIARYCHDRLDRGRWVVPLSGMVRHYDDDIRAGGCCYLAPGEAIQSISSDASALIGSAPA